MSRLEHHFVVPFERSFDAAYGLQYLGPTRGRVTVRPELLGADGTVQSGVYAAMAESIASTATAVEVVPEGLIPSGLSNSTHVVGDVRSGVLGDLYLNLMAFRPDGSNATIRAIYQPLVPWIWFGGGVVVFGAFVAGWPTARRRRAPATVTVPTPPSPAREPEYAA